MVIAVFSLPGRSAVVGADIVLGGNAVRVEVVGPSSEDAFVCGRACDVFVEVDCVEKGICLVGAVLVAVI